MQEKAAKLANLVCGYSIKTKPGDIVYIKGEIEAIPLISACYKEVLQKGGKPYVNITFPDQNYIFYTNAKKSQIERLTKIDYAIAENANSLISVLCKNNTKELTNVDHGKIALAAKSGLPLRKIMDRREKKKEFNWVVVPFPSVALAQDAGTSLSDYSDFVFKACFLDKQDPISEWKNVSKELNKYYKLLKNSKRMRIVGHETDLTLSVAGREWIKCDGLYNLPDGELFTSPVENSAEGNIYFDYPTTYNGVEAEGIYLEFSKGKITKVKAKKGEDFVKKMVAMDKGSSFLGEIAFGLNKGIQKATKNILFDEKIGGSIHLAIGKSYPEAGGKNESGLHWDMVKNMKKGSKIFIEDRLVYQNGKFIK